MACNNIYCSRPLIINITKILLLHTKLNTSCAERVILSNNNCIICTKKSMLYGILGRYLPLIV